MVLLRGSSRSPQALCGRLVRLGLSCPGGAGGGEEEDEDKEPTETPPRIRNRQFPAWVNPVSYLGYQVFLQIP